MPDINVQLPDGSNVAFPDGTSQDVMTGAIRAHLKMPTNQTVQAAQTETAPAAKGDVRPSTSSVYQQVKSQIVDPALGVGQQTLSAIKDIPSVFAPHFSQDELQKGKALVSSMPLVDAKDPGTVGAYLGATIRRGGQAANDALAVASSPFNLATAGIQQHISNVLAPWQNIAKSMYGQNAHVDTDTGRYTTGNEDIDKTIDNVVGAIPFAMAEGAIHPTPSAFDSDIAKLRKGVPLKDSSEAQNVKSTHVGPISQLNASDVAPSPEKGLQISVPAKAPVEAQAPTETSGASRVGNAPVVDRQSLISPEGPKPPAPDTDALISPRPQERRTDTAQRLKVSQMSPEQMQQELLTSKITDLPNRRAFDEAPDSAVTGMSDADGLKALNDKYGYAAGNALLKAKADALKQVGLDAYHDKGDEFLYKADSPEELSTKLQQAREVLKNKVIEAPMADGSIKRFKGADFSFGVGKDMDEAESGLKAHKAQREAAGERARGELRGITEQGQPQPVAPSQAKSFDLPQQVHDNFDRIADLKRKADLAETDSQADSLNQKATEAENQSADQLKSHIKTLSWDQLQQLRDDSSKRSQALDAQAKAISDLTEATVKNRGVKNEIADMRAQGGPFRRVVDPESGEANFAKPDTKVARGARSVFDELQGRVPTSDFNSIDVVGKPEGVSDQEWADHVSKLRDERLGLKRKISDAVTIAAETGASIADMGIDDHVDRLKMIDSMLGKYSEPAETGRRPNITPQLDEQGAIKASEVLKSWTLDRARLALGKNLRAIPTDEEFFQHADMRAEKSRLYKSVADVSQKLLDYKNSQRGGVGERPLQGAVKRVSLDELAQRVPSDKEVLNRANAANLTARPVSEASPAGYKGLLSKDGKTWVGANDHDQVADTLLPELPPDGSALRAMLQKGWIRKESPVNYEAWDFSKGAAHTIENDLWDNGKHGQALRIDTQDAQGRVKALSLPVGWDRVHDSLEEAINAEKRRQGFNSNTGAVSGTKMLAGGTVGSVIGTVVGAHLGHPLEGGAIGWGLGFMTPAIAEHPAMLKLINTLKPGLAQFGISMKDWLMGPTQREAINPDMKSILDAQQRDVRGPVKSLLTRIAQLPGDVQHAMFDKFVFINDRPGAIINFLMKGDERGRFLRDLKGKLDVDNSPYVSAWLAAGGGGGALEAHLIDYKSIYTDAQKGGHINNLNEYLNLKGYQRVYDVMQERMQEHDTNIAQLKQALAQPNLHVEVEAGMRKALRGSQEERQDIIDKLTSKTLVPDPYDPPKIAADLQNLQTTLGPKFAQVKGLADRVFALNRKVLDMAHQSGIVGDPEYQKYTARGDEYIPMHRILEQIADNDGRISGKGQGSLYLRRQNIIKALMGSDKINRDPIIASADANLEALREIMRNGVIKDYLRLAQADPQGVGTYFKQVAKDYKAQPGEGIVGVYENGQSINFVTDKWLSESLQNVSPSSLDVIGKGPLTAFSQILRKGATLGNLAWSIPNAIRHLGDMAIMSDAGLKSIRTLPKDVVGMMKEWTKSLYSSMQNDPKYQGFLSSGAAYSGLQRAISPEEHLDLNTLGFKQKIAHGRIIDVVQDFNAAVEDATKMTTYSRLRQAGYTEKASAWETRQYGGGPDYARQGNLSPAIGLASMFFNAHLQYVTRVFARAAENPVRVATALGAISAMAMALNQHNAGQKDEKGNSLLRKVPYTDRENNFVILSGHTYQSTSGATLPVYYKVPKDSFVKFLYNPIENMLNKMTGVEERSGTQLGLQALGNLSPGQMDLQEGQVGASAVRGVVSSLNPVIKTPLEEAMNYKTTGFGQPIVPGRETNIQSQFQYGPGTSATAKRIGEGGVRGAVAGGAEGASIGYLLAGGKGAALGGGLGAMTGAVGVSPRRAEHIIDSTTAGVGRIATGFVDPFLGGVKQTQMEGPEKLVNTPIAGPIAARFVSTSVDQQEENMTNQFYQNAAKAQVPMATLQFLKKNHPEQVLPFIEKNKSDLWRSSVATQMSSRMSQILNAQKEIESNASMAVKDKQDALKNLHEVKMQVLNVFTRVLKPGGVGPQQYAMPGQGQGNAR